MTQRELREGITEYVPLANERVKSAERLRRQLRKTIPKSLERNDDILIHIRELKIAGIWLRPLLGALQWHEIPAMEERRLRGASYAVQTERRNLRKMLR